MLAAGAFALPQRIESLAMMDVSGQASSLASSLAHPDCKEDSAKPFKEGDDCVAQCSEGHAPDSKDNCEQCDGDTPYADHVAHKCVATCPAGYAGNDDKDCEQCDGETPYADHVAHECVATCPAGYAGNSTSGN